MHLASLGYSTLISLPQPAASTLLPPPQTLMTNDRSHAYGRVVKTLEDMGPAKLQPGEQELIRSAADALFFDGDAYEELAAVEDLAQALVTADRWTPERARALVDDVAACGPGVGVH